MARAEKNETNGSAAKGGTTAGIVKLSDLTIQGREFELLGKNYRTKSPITLTLPEIAKIDMMGKKLNSQLPAFGEGRYEEVNVEEFEKLLLDMAVLVSDAPEEVVKQALWWQQFLIIGLFQSVAGMDFLGEQLPKLAGVPEEQREKIKQALKTGMGKKTTTSTSPTP